MLTSLISQTRRNHALEHATIHVLSEKHPNRFSAQGNSTASGFYLNIYGDLNEEEVRQAVMEAYSRLKGGERKLAIHPNCGTVLVTTATLATLASQLALGLEMLRRRQRKLTPGLLVNALPSAILAAALGMLVSRPLGMSLQERYTTDGNLGPLHVSAIRRVSPSPVTRLFQFLLGQTQNQHVTSYQISTHG